VNPLFSILRNWSTLASSQVVSSLIAMALMIAVSRVLGDVEFGRLYLALTFVTIVGVAVDLGVSQVMTREVARERALTRSYLRRAVVVVGVVGTCLYVALIAAVQSLFTPEVRTLVLILGLLVVVEGFALILAAVFQAHERMAVPALTRVAANALSLIVAVPLLITGHGVATVAIVLVLAAAARVAVQAFAVRRLEGFHLTAPMQPAWRGLLLAGLPFLAAQALGLFVARVNVLVLGMAAAEAAVGWYAAAARVMESLNFIPVVLTMATFPVLSRLWSRSRSEFETTVRKMLHLLLIVTVPVSVTLFALAPDIIGFLFTPEYAAAVPVLRIQAVSLALIFVDFLLVCVLMSVGRERLWLAIVGAACLLSPAVSWLLIPLTDMRFANAAIGAALGTTVTEVFILCCALRAVPSGIFDARSIGIVMRAGAVGVALGAFLLVGRALGLPWVLAAVAGLSLYLALVLLTGMLPADVATWVRALVVRRRSPAAPTLASERGVDAA
jgi:O-antigen/teichoic acid export membrane protein